DTVGYGRGRSGFSRFVGVTLRNRARFSTRLTPARRGSSWAVTWLRMQLLQLLRGSWVRPRGRGKGRRNERRRRPAVDRDGRCRAGADRPRRIGSY
ncbi:hypothetical protein PFISCL1PPCAC_26191, partial [Pristionchus fissidentatus]